MLREGTIFKNSVIEGSLGKRKETSRPNSVK
jgi:hypothetical protein